MLSRPFLTFFLLLFPAFVSASDTPSTLLIGHRPTFSPADPVLQHFKCSMQHVQHPFQFQPVSPADANPLLQKASLDGYLPAMPDDNLSRTARFSAPLQLQNWYWFWHQRHKGPDSTGTIRYGVITGSYQAEWLDKTGYKAEAEASSLTELVKLLAAGLVDVVLADLEQFNQVATQLNLPLQQYRQRFSRYVPLGVYFSEQRLQDSPALLRHFNAANHLCAGSSMTLAGSEQDKITQLILAPARQLTSDQMLLDTVQQQNRLGHDVVYIMQQDQLWQQQLQQGSAAAAEQMLQSDLSRQLQQWKKTYGNIVTEIILMDNKGANVAISNHTPDYWQGDESIFVSVFEQSAPYAISPLDYNPLSQRVEVYISVPVISGAGKHIGVLAVGIDVSQALSAP